MKLSRTVAYALKATLMIAQDTTGKPVPCRRLADEGSMPERFLLQVLRRLTTHGILKSTRGMEGGYVLEKQPEDISVLNIIQAIDGIATSSFELGEGLPGSGQRLVDLLEAVNNSMLDELRAITISQLLSVDDTTEPRAAPTETVSHVASPTSVHVQTTDPSLDASTEFAN